MLGDACGRQGAAELVVLVIEALRKTGATGLEPATSGVTGRRSNQLNYAPLGGSIVACPRRMADRKRKRERPPAWLHVPGEEELPEEVRSLFARAEEKLGFVPNVFRVFALRPEHLLRWRAFYDELLRGESRLTPAQREMIAVVVSAQNRCYY